MAIAFSSSELIDIAIGIEKRGIAFYDVIARSTEKTGTRQLFQYLSDMEREHLLVFQNMAVSVKSYEPAENYPEEYTGYLEAIIDSAVFTDELVSSETVARISNHREALDLGISIEKDSILFYYEMRDMMPAQAQPAVNQIISEEKSHLKQLSELKKKLLSH